MGGSFDDSPNEQRFDFPYVMSWQAVGAEDTYAAQHTMVDGLRSMVGKRELLWRTSLDTSVNQYQYAQATLLGVWPDQNTRTNLHQSFNFRFQIHTHWHGGHVGDTWFLDAGHILDNGRDLDLDGGKTTLTGDTSTSISVTYTGNLPQTNVICTITNGTGSTSITATTIEIGDTELEWSGTLTAGKALVIDGGDWSCKLDGIDDYDALDRGSGHTLETWFLIENGVNTGDVDLTGGTGGSTSPTVVFELYEIYA